MSLFTKMQTSCQNWFFLVNRRTASPTSLFRNKCVNKSESSLCLLLPSSLITSCVGSKGYRTDSRVKLAIHQRPGQVYTHPSHFCQGQSFHLLKGNISQNVLPNASAVGFGLFILGWWTFKRVEVQAQKASTRMKTIGFQNIVCFVKFRCS